MSAKTSDEANRRVRTLSAWPPSRGANRPLDARGFLRVKIFRIADGTIVERWRPTVS
ncbi:MAG TPA: hypothetical protein VJ301_11305 [Propionibacteriaceae bacterium]|nr:hypothetical protein [Propionibacteriaceae bacterium]